jgi:hypothetical protein
MGTAVAVPYTMKKRGNQGFWPIFGNFSIIFGDFSMIFGNFWQFSIITS